MKICGSLSVDRRHRVRFSAFTLLLSSVAAITALATEKPAIAQTVETIYSIAPGPLNQALAAFGRQSGIQITYVPSNAASKQSPGVSGRLSPDAAIARILTDSGLSYRFTNPRTIVISGQSAYGPVDGYVATSASSAMKGDISILETPQAISVVTADRIEDQAAQSINEALRYTAGVRSETSGAQMMDNPLYLRGFQQSSLEMYQDGLRAVTPGYFGFFAADPYGLERVEVLKGPSSVLYGQQAPGGLINVVSKRPTENPINEVETTIGSFSHYQGAFDIGGTNEDKSIMYRMVGMAREAETQVDYVDNDRRYLAPSITWTPDEDTKLTVLGSYQRNDGDFYAQVPAAAVLLPNPNGHIPFSRFVGEPDWEYETSRRTAIGYEFEHRFNDTVQFEQNFRYTHLTNHRQYLQASGALVDNRLLNRTYNLRDIDNDGIAVDSRFRFDFDTGPIEHRAIVGLDYLWGKSRWLEQRGTATAIDIYNPVYGSPVDTSVYTTKSLPTSMPHRPVSTFRIS